MPLHGLSQNHYYSFNLGPAHFIFLNVDLFYEQILINRQPFIDWLKADLAIADSEEARKERPWIIVQGSDPVYCGDKSNWRCKGEHYKDVKEIFHEHNVDLFISGHTNIYERLPLPSLRCLLMLIRMLPIFN